MRKIEKNIYKFYELSKEIQEIVKEKIKDEIIEDNFEFFSEDLKDWLENHYNLKNFEIDYSFAYCQGDGCCFYRKNGIISYFNLKNNDLTKMNIFEKFIIENYKNEELDFILKYFNEEYNIYIEKISYHYTHKYTCDINYEIYSSYNNDEKEKIMELINGLVVQFKELYYKICDEIEEIGYNYYEVSEDELLERINEYEYEFNEDGEVITCQ